VSSQRPAARDMRRPVNLLLLLKKFKSVFLNEPIVNYFCYRLKRIRNVATLQASVRKERERIFSMVGDIVNKNP
jgi:hypothetical protein